MEQNNSEQILPSKMPKFLRLYMSFRGAGVLLLGIFVAFGTLMSTIFFGSFLYGDGGPQYKGWFSNFIPFSGMWIWIIPIAALCISYFAIMKRKKWARFFEVIFIVVVIALDLVIWSGYGNFSYTHFITVIVSLVFLSYFLFSKEVKNWLSEPGFIK